MRAERANKTAWVAENDSDMLNLLIYTLRRLGFEVESFADGRALVERIEAMGPGGDAPALFVTDHHMPYVHGLDIIALLRAEHVDVKIVVVTAFGDDDLISRAERLGVEAVLNKPFDLTELEAAITRATG